MACRLSIAVPTFNRGPMLERCLRSALDHDLEGVEVLVLDNHSTDNTEAVVRQFEGRVQYFRHATNLGLFKNFNECLKRMSGEVQLILCSDDILRPGALRRALDEFDREPAATVVSTLAEYVSADGHVMGRQRPQLPIGFYPGNVTDRAVLTSLISSGRNPLNYPSGVFFKRSADRFREDLPMGADLEFFLRQARNGGLVLVDAVGCQVTIHRGSESNFLADTEYPILDKVRLINDVPRQNLPDVSRGRLLRSLKGQAGLIAIKRLLSLNRAGYRTYARLARGIPGSATGASLDACKLLIKRTRSALSS